MMRLKQFISFFALLVCLVGCGYNFPGKGGALPAGVEKVYIPLFINKTAEPQLEIKLTSRISEVFSRNSKISQVGKQELADASLEGTILNYSSKALSYDPNDDIGEYRATMVVNVLLRQPETELPLWDRVVSLSEEYSSATNKNDQDDLEQLAIDEITLRLAEEVLYQLLDDF